MENISIYVQVIPWQIPAARMIYDTKDCPHAQPPLPMKIALELFYPPNGALDAPYQDLILSRPEKYPY